LAYRLYRVKPEKAPGLRAARAGMLLMSLREEEELCYVRRRWGSVRVADNSYVFSFCFLLLNKPQIRGENIQWTYNVVTERPEKAFAEMLVRAGQLVSSLHQGRNT
jgi:hypothetical protein